MQQQEEGASGHQAGAPPGLRLSYSRTSNEEQEPSEQKCCLLVQTECCQTRGMRTAKGQRHCQALQKKMAQLQQLQQQQQQQQQQDRLQPNRREQAPAQEQQAR
jgi:hypothetical protein